MKKLLLACVLMLVAGILLPNVAEAVVEHNHSASHQNDVISCQSNIRETDTRIRFEQVRIIQKIYWNNSNFSYYYIRTQNDVNRTSLTTSQAADYATLHSTFEWQYYNGTGDDYTRGPLYYNRFIQ